MKKTVFLLVFLTVVLLLGACRAAEPPYGETTPPEDGTTLPSGTDGPTHVSSQETTAPLDVTTSRVTTALTSAEKPTVSIPEDYYSLPEAAVYASSITIPSVYNEGIAYDLVPYIDAKSRTVFFFLPTRADLSCVVYHLYDAQGKFRMGRVADFTSTNTHAKRVTLNGTLYTIKAYRSDCPTLYLEIDERYGTMEDVQNDTSKERCAYGDLLLESRTEFADAKGFLPSYQSRENDAASPCTMYIKGRGNWSWLSTEKQGYSIKLESKEALLGMGKSKKWALIANVPDPTMLRNTLAYYLGKAAEMPYTSSGEIVDLFVNGEYYGNFLLAEKVDVADERVEIRDLEDAIESMMGDSEDYGVQRTKVIREMGISLKYWTDVPNPADISGGYLLEMEMPDRYAADKSGFRTKRNFYYVIQSPEYASYEQVLYIATLVQEMEDALFAADGVHPITGKAYTDYLDLDSAVKKYWVDEISKNHDSVKTSAYFYKDADSRSEKIYMGPVWDYDIAFGISSETTDPYGWYACEKSFYEALWQHESFTERASELYKTLFYPALCRYLDSEIDALAEHLAASAEMNHCLWQNLDRDYFSYVETLKDYLQKRAEWLLQAVSNGLSARAF